MSSFTLPPIAPPSFPTAREGSPIPEDEPTDSIAVGVELLISGLDHSAPGTAVIHFNKVLDHLQATQPDDPLPPLRVLPGDARKAVDYVFVALLPGVSPTPRPDILETYRKAIDGHEGLRAIWRPGSGLDRTRRLVFAADNEAHARDMQDVLGNWLNANGAPFQSSYVSQPSNQWRITFDLLDRDTVSHIESNPPTYKSRVYAPTRPRFIIPEYGLELPQTNLR
ncbi:hypothetical protein EVJ58_g10513 [Rhodofomes roseus]|uniref:Uncharacterized protein n=1 Tax=Rhodofomes roseus TaxID=34475 RepID=A0A4Y9XN64_9APHY|nr:hypothetical protein EVJ58_g10513 [Rhodofomes roseus]